MKNAVNGQRLIAYHKQPISARLRFLVFEQDEVLYPEPLPALVTPTKETGGVSPLPTSLATQLCRTLGLPADSLELEPPALEYLETPDEIIEVHSVRFTTYDAPVEEVGAVGARFVELAHARFLPMEMLQLMRHIYERALD